MVCSSTAKAPKLRHCSLSECSHLIQYEGVPADLPGHVNGLYLVTCQSLCGLQVEARTLPAGHPIMRTSSGLRGDLLPPVDGVPQPERGLYAKKVRSACTVS